MLHEEREVDADEERPEVDLAPLLGEHLPGHLREPVVDAREGAHHDTHDHVVHVRDDEVRVGEAEVDRRHRLEDAAEPTDQEDERACRWRTASGFLPRHTEIADFSRARFAANSVSQTQSKRIAYIVWTF